ncbi:MAG TPA: serine/threonine-protein kinase [Candidatus Dormibacteraeota bacterium]
MRDLTGTTLGHHEIKERLGAGGMAVVYRAIQQPLGREVALKVLAPALVAEPGFSQRFENEARALAALDHPNILPIYDFDRAGELVYFTMPLVRGGSLRDLMREGPIKPVDGWRYLRETGDALHHAHEAGIIHRDLKPGNVLIHADGRALLADFGLARTATQDLQLTAVGFTVGTPGYMAPEQVLGHPVDRRADIYSLAVIVFEMLTGRPPFTGTTPMEVANFTVNAPIPSACAINHNLPDELDRLLEKALAKDPSARPPSAAIFVQEMGRLPQRRVVSSAVAPMRDAPAPAPPAPPAATPPPAGSAIAILEQQGVRRLRATRSVVQNSYWANSVHVAREVAGDAWAAVIEAAGLTAFAEQDGPADDGYQVPADALSRLNEAFEKVFGSQAPDRVRMWGRQSTERSLRLRKAGNAAFRLVPGRQRKTQILLKAFTESMDEVRGEHTHTWRQVDERQFWVVNFSNLYALGRRKPEKACWFWTSTLEAMLRWAGLANEWYVEEVECGMVTGAFDCVFALRSARG